MTLRHTIRVLSVVALSLSAAACGRHGRANRDFHMMMARQQGGMHRMHRMHRGMGDPVAQVLDHQAALRLTPAQVNSLISIDEKLIADNTPLRDRLMALRPAMGGDRGKKADSSNAAAHIPQRDSAATIFQQMRENRWRAMNAAYGQLTEEQMGMVARAGGGRPGGGRPGGFGGRGGSMPDGNPGPGGRMGKPRGGGGGNAGGPPSRASDGEG